MVSLLLGVGLRRVGTNFGDDKSEIATQSTPSTQL
jgi:hypothetical protein